MFRNNLCLEIGDDPVENGTDGAVIDPLEIAEVNIQVNFAKLRPGVHRQMALAEADNTSETAWFEIVVDFPQFLQAECAGKVVGKGLKSGILD